MAMERYGVHGVRVYQLNNCEAFLVSVLARFSLGPQAITVTTAWGWTNPGRIISQEASWYRSTTKSGISKLGCEASQKWPQNASPSSSI